MAWATPTELGAWIDDTPPPDVGRLLDRASEAISDATLGAIYDTNDDDEPTDATVVAAFRDATCAQVEWWIETGDDMQAASQFSSFGIGSVSLTRANSATTGTVPGVLAPRARRILRTAGLLNPHIVPA